MTPAQHSYEFERLTREVLLNPLRRMKTPGEIKEAGKLVAEMASLFDEVNKGKVIP